MTHIAKVDRETKNGTEWYKQETDQVCGPHNQSKRGVNVLIKVFTLFERTMVTVCSHSPNRRNQCGLKQQQQRQRQRQLEAIDKKRLRGSRTIGNAPGHRRPHTSGRRAATTTTTTTTTITITITYYLVLSQTEGEKE